MAKKIKNRLSSFKTYLSALEPDVLQVIINLPITSKTVKEASETRSMKFSFLVKLNKICRQI